MPQVRPVEKIQRAAYHFAHISRVATEIADAFGVSEWAVRKWAKTPEWDKALDAFGYQGDRAFEARPKRDAIREQGQTFTAVYDAYRQRLRAGEPTHRISRLVEEATGVDRRKVRDWARYYKWKGEEL